MYKLNTLIVPLSHASYKEIACTLSNIHSPHCAKNNSTVQPKITKVQQCEFDK